MFYVVLFDATNTRSDVAETEDFFCAVNIAEEELTRAVGDGLVEPFVIVYDEDTFPAAILDTVDDEVFGLVEAA